MTGGTSYWVRADLRHRRSAVIGLALLVAVAAVVPFTAAAAARRTASSVDRMREELRPYHADVQFEEGEPPADALERLRAVPGVEVAAEGASILARPRGSERGFLTSFGQGGIGPEIGTTFERLRLRTGRLPASDDEVVISSATAKELGLSAGDVLHLETLTWDGLMAGFEGEQVGYDGPVVPLRVVGVGDQPESLTAGDGPSAPSFVLVEPFFRRWEREVAFFADIFIVRLRDGFGAGPAFERAVREAFPDRSDVSIHLSEERFRIDDAVAAQAWGLVALALASGLAAVVAIGQAVRRHLRASSGDQQALQALGADRSGLRSARVTATLLPIAAGAAIAGAGSIMASAWFPTGAAGRLEPDPGVRLDWTVTLLGVAVALAVAVAVALPAPRRPAGPRRSRLVVGLEGTRLPVPVVSGLRAALQPADGVQAAPLRAAVVASVAGIAGVFAAVVLGASVNRLVETPSRYGFNFDLAVSVGDSVGDEQAMVAAAPLRDLPEVRSALLARVNNVIVEDREQFVFATDVVAGTPSFTVLTGRAPQVEGEVALGPKSLRELGTAVGETVTGRGVDGGDVPLRVVGTALFPVVENEDPAQGTWVTLDTYETLRSQSEGFPDLFVDLVEGADVGEAIAAIEEIGFVTPEARPAVIGNLRGVSTIPYALAGFLGALAVVAVAHALLSALRGRRRELAVLRTLGLSRAGSAASVLVHATAYAVIGLLVGGPLGIAAGARTWRTVAGNLGFATDALVPAWTVLVAPVAIGVVLLVAAMPARSAATTPVAELLRTE